ncbi:NAD-dependent protein deacetylase [Specibacter cremeus]|uniref:NAD-dependent protein deacetylase n=1 Tax=Specibacter cremeus TaxID=1629051 RepID=UPI000F766767|nr:NAD-dependent protein deacetylase [Specibacter cremeus]
MPASSGPAGLAGLLSGVRFAVLTGAGLSTDSGIPDYRGPNAVPRTPVTYQEFMRSAEARQRYWARNQVGWQRMHHAAPNAGHRAVAALERLGVTTGIITQNVDRLHEDAGAENVVDLHGRFDRVRCLRCGEVFARAFVASLLVEANPGFLDAVAARGGAQTAPDADAVLDPSLVSSFHVVVCPVCGGLLKPDVVFFGENVPRHRVSRSFSLVDEAGALLVAGSSLTVMSGLRFVRKAAHDGKPVLIVNRGHTRGDELATLKLDTGVGEALAFLAASLEGSRAGWRSGGAVR